MRDPHTEAHRMGRGKGIYVCPTQRPLGQPGYELPLREVQRTVWSVNDFSFATPTCDTCHLALLSHSNPTVSHAQPVGGNSMSPRAAQESPGSGRYRLADAWRATAQHSVGPGVLAEAGPDSWWPLSSEAPLYTPLGPCKGLWSPSRWEPANCTSWLASCPRGMGTVPRFTISLDGFQLVPVGRRCTLLPSESLEIQRGASSWILGEGKDGGMVSVLQHLPC